MSYRKYSRSFEYQSIMFQVLRHADMYEWVLEYFCYSEKSIYLRLKKRFHGKLSVRISDHESLNGFPDSGSKSFWINPYGEFWRYVLLMWKLMS